MIVNLPGDLNVCCTPLSRFLRRKRIIFYVSSIKNCLRPTFLPAEATVHLACTFSSACSHADVNTTFSARFRLPLFFRLFFEQREYFEVFRIKGKLNEERLLSKAETHQNKNSTFCMSGGGTGEWGAKYEATGETPSCQNRKKKQTYSQEISRSENTKSSENSGQL